MYTFKINLLEDISSLYFILFLFLFIYSFFF